MSSVDINQFEYILYYWPKTAGRGEYMRLLFEETQTPYYDYGLFHTDFSEFAQTQFLPRRKQGIAYAPPILEHRVKNEKPIIVSQSLSIVRYLAKHLQNGRLYPKSEADISRADELVETAADLVNLGHDAWHPNRNESFENNKGPLQEKLIKEYKEKYLVNFCNYFETVLQNNGGQYFVGKELSYADLVIFHVLDGNEFECTEEFEKLTIPTLKEFMKQIRQREHISNYLQSQRRQPFTKTGPIF